VNKVLHEREHGRGFPTKPNKTGYLPIFAMRFNIAK